MRRETDFVLAGIPARVSRLESGLAENTSLTRTVDENTRTIVTFVHDVDVVWKFCKGFRRVTFRVSKWIAAISAAVAGVVGAAHALGTVDVRSWFR